MRASECARHAAALRERTGHVDAAAESALVVAVVAGGAQWCVLIGCPPFARDPVGGQAVVAEPARVEAAIHSEPEERLCAAFADDLQRIHCDKHGGRPSGLGAG